MWALVALCLAVAFAVTLWFVAATIFVRLPYWGEAEVLFEARRMHEGLPLFVDPLVGAQEYGSPPSRYYVTYPPIWSWIVSWVPITIQLGFARLACTIAWFGTLVALARRARPESRPEALAAAVFVAGLWVLANFATVGRPDAIACAVAAVALDRTVRRGELDLVSAALFVVVPWIKPTVVGLPAFAIVGSAVVGGTQGRRVAGFAAVLAMTSAIVGFVFSGGVLFDHVARSNVQPFSLDVWLGQVPGRILFFAPLLGWAGWLAQADRDDPGMRIGLWALAGAVGWTLFALAKTGSSSNYWMEPCVAAVVLIARAAPGPVRFGRSRLAHALVALSAVLWADVASVRAALEHAASERVGAEVVSQVRAKCGASPGDPIASDEAGIELVLDGRILTPAYQMAHLVKAGRLPVGPWRDDLATARCFVEHTGQLALVPELEEALEASFVPFYEASGFRVWKRR